jgi:hypothetical protein
MTVYPILYVMYFMCSIFGFHSTFNWSWILVFHCVTSSGHDVKLKKHGLGVIMSSSLCVTGLGGNGHMSSSRVRGTAHGAGSSSKSCS